MITKTLPEHLGLIPMLYHLFFIEKFITYNSYAFAIFIFGVIIFQLACLRISKKIRQEAKLNYPEAFA
jgi:hypothetical protein